MVAVESSSTNLDNRGRTSLVATTAGGRWNSFFAAQLETKRNLCDVPETILHELDLYYAKISEHHEILYDTQNIIYLKEICFILY